MGATATHGISDSLAKLATPLGDLTPAPDNVRLHDQRSIQSIAASLKAYGQQKPVVALPDGTIIAGNGTLAAARSLGWTHIAAARFLGDADKAKAFAIADNRTADLSGFDETALADALMYLEGVGTDLTAMGFTDAEYMSLVNDMETAAGNIEVPPDPGEAGDGADTDLPGGESPSSHVRMVQLFLNEQTQPVFMDACRALSEQMGTTNVTDTVMRAVCDAAGIDVPKEQVAA